jgi:hypothetical protein
MSSFLRRLDQVFSFSIRLDLGGLASWVSRNGVVVGV